MTALDVRTGVTSPYVGLRPYLPQDARFFFGRDREVRRLMACIFSAPLTIVYGPSGVGKSSLLNAGLWEEVTEQRNDLIAVMFNHWHDGNAGSAVVGALVDAASAAGVQIEADGAESLEVLRRLATRVAAAELSEQDVRLPILLVLDQFEDLFKYHDRNEGFEDLLSAIVRNLGAAISVVVSIREDSLASLDVFQSSVPDLFGTYVRVDYLNETAAIEAIERPLEKWEELHGETVTAAPALVEALLRDVEVKHASGEVGAVRSARAGERLVETAYMQLVLERLWREREGDVLSADLYLRLGRAEAILRQHVDTELAALPQASQELVVMVLPHIVTASGRKLAQHAADLGQAMERSSSDIADVLEQLARSGRILRALDPETTDREFRRYEPYHDRVAEALNDWRRRYLTSGSTTARLRFRLENQFRRAKALAQKDNAPEQQQALRVFSRIASSTVAPALAEQAREQIGRLITDGVRKDVRDLAQDQKYTFDREAIEIVEASLIGAFETLQELLATVEPDLDLLEVNVQELVELTDLLVEYTGSDDKALRSRALGARERLSRDLHWPLEVVADQLRPHLGASGTDRVEHVLDAWGPVPDPGTQVGSSVSTSSWSSVSGSVWTSVSTRSRSSGTDYRTGSDPITAAFRIFSYLRVALAALVLLLLVAVVLEWWSDQRCLQPSISDYYFTPVGPVLIAVLVATGACLVALKGNTAGEDVLKNLAGLLAPAVAFIPTPAAGRCGVSDAGENVADTVANNMTALFVTGLVFGVCALVMSRREVAEEGLSSVKGLGMGVTVIVLACGAAWFVVDRGSFLEHGHDAAAIPMFLAIIGTVWLNARDVSGAVAQGAAPPTAVRYVTIYRTIALTMLVALTAVVAISLSTGSTPFVLWLEVVLVTLFAVFWLVQAVELSNRALRAI